MEYQLYQAASGLPEPTLTFAAIRSTPEVKKQKAVPGIIKFAVAALLILCISISSFAYVKTNYSMWVGPDIVTRQGIKRSTDYALPAELGGIGFWSANKLYLVHQGTSEWDALLKPLYVVWSACYGETVKKENDQSGWERQIHYTVYISPMDDALWRHFIGFTEDNIWSPDTLNESSYYTVSYKDCILQLGTTGTSERCHVYWIDSEHNVCIGVSSNNAADLEKLEEIAKELIDLNG